MTIELIGKESELIEKGVEFFWECWGSETNFAFYDDCIRNSFSSESPLPKFYLLLNGQAIIGSYALLRNDIISRQDLVPWLACLYVHEDFRSKGLAEQLLDHALVEARQKGYDTLYLSTDLNKFYESKGWTFYKDGYGVDGNQIKIYRKSTQGG